MKILTIQELKEKNYPGSQITIEQELGKKEGYHAYLVSYQSEGLKIYGYLTVPAGKKPPKGWPAILFNHGYIPLDKFKTDRQYVRYLAHLAKAGYVVFKPDFRGHGQSEGEPSGNFESGYAIDAINALESLKKLPAVNPDRIGVWGHSMGGHITLKVLLVKPEIKAAVIWAAKYQSISPVSFIHELNMPIQLHHGLLDERIPTSRSEEFKEVLEKLGKSVELYLYPEGNHNLSGPELKIAMDRSVKFFNQFL
ncbi:MAG: S9 family peptidase [Candidatus Daviesbacteria bacterium]|nr:MAG: S9 family peptidase [Candidatus Daviesbacteria bacterium]